ncbi:MAG TPA: helix-turn-helix domain-containing protein [Gammaproteobacteria bacterium]|nr:helix-turn-helix domain-containing protein [Gammaproteobacteria bacterium]
MKTDSARRSNQQRTEATRSALIDAARELFVAKGYAETSTPEIVAAAGLTRGALYHHFADKQALFRAVVEQESAAVAHEIEKATPATLSPQEALIRGGEAFLEAMAVGGRTRLLLLDGPAVLGRAVMDEIDNANGARTLREGIAEAMRVGMVPALPLEALTALLAAGFDRAALAVEAGGKVEDYRQVLGALIGGLMSDRTG